MLVLQIASAFASAVQAPENMVVDEEFDAAVTKEIAALPEKLRTVMRLVDIDELSYVETACLLGIPRGTVMSRLHRARARIRQQLAAAGLAPKRRGGR